MLISYIERLQKFSGFCFVIDQIHIMGFKRPHKRLATHLTVKIRIKIAQIADKIGIVDQWIPTIESFVIKVILPIFPVVRNDTIAIVRHVFIDGEAAFKSRYSMLHDIQGIGEADEGGIFFQMEGIANAEILQELGILSIGLLAERVFAPLRAGLGFVRWS